MYRIIRTVITTIIALVATVALAGTAFAHETHVVEPGDTLSEIAADNGTDWQTVFKWNSDEIDDPDLIYPGQEFLVERGGDRPSRSDDRPEPSSNSDDSEESSSNDGGGGSGGGKAHPATGSVTSDYGMRTHPISGVYKLHSGVDFSTGDGYAYAAAAGSVSVTWKDWAGNLVTVTHGGGIETRYAHLANVYVSDGQSVDAGDQIGEIGAVGMATGPHLHFEVLQNGEFISPWSWLD